jgi:hypothetical protein
MRLRNLLKNGQTNIDLIRIPTQVRILSRTQNVGTVHFTCTITATKHFETSTGFEAVRGDANRFFKIITFYKCTGLSISLLR